MPLCAVLTPMAFVHRTTLVPGKLDLLTPWLPTQRWFRGTGSPDLSKAGGFRLDDPAGEVGIEVLFVTDTANPDVSTTYVVPLTYRGAPHDDAADALIGTSQHGVLGLRYVYDAVADTVFRAQLAALGSREVSAQQQSVSNTVDDSVLVAGFADEWEIERILTEHSEDRAPLAGGEPGEITALWHDLFRNVRRGLVATGRAR